MYELWYNCIKEKYADVKLCYIDDDTFIKHIKTEGFHKNVLKDVRYRLDTPNCEAVKSVLMGEIKNY